MAKLGADREIVELEWRKVTSIAWPVLSLLSIVSALASHTPFKPWQIFYIIGLVLTLIFSYLLRKFDVLKFSDTPTVLFLLIAPLVIGDRADTSWTSLGLIVFAAVIYFSALENIRLAISIILLLCIFQSTVASIGYASFTDSADLSLLYSYFSTVWTLVIGVASVFIRKSYFEKADRIEEKIDAEINQSLNELSSLRQVNQKDSFNIKLHGTILNTLIYMRNALNAGLGYEPARENLEKEINSLEIQLEQVEQKEATLLSLSMNRTLNRVNVTFNGSTVLSEAPVLNESVGEIIREFLLNLEKHTEASHLDVSIVESLNDTKIIFFDNGADNAKSGFSLEQLEKPKKSISLMNILKECAATIEITRRRQDGYRRTEIKIPKLKIEESLSDSIAKARLLGLNDFVLNFIRAGYLALVISIPGYLVVGTDKVILALLLILGLSFLFVLRGSTSHLPLLLAVISSSLLIPVSSYFSATCVELAVMPWIWNHILTVGFYVAVEVRNIFLKWLPIALLTAQSVIYPFTYPSQCQAIFQGSVPGIPLFIVLALSVMQIRKRELNFEKFQAEEILRLAQLSSDSDLLRRRELSRLVSDSKKFVSSFDALSSASAKQQLLNLEIEKIQTYLVCSEYFHSPIVRNVYELFRSELDSGNPGKVQIMGAFSSLREDQVDSKLLLEIVADEKRNRPISLTIVFVDQLELIFEGYEEVELKEREHDYGAFKLVRQASLQ